MVNLLGLNGCIKIWNENKLGARLYWSFENEIFVCCSNNDKMRKVYDTYPEAFRLVQVKRHKNDKLTLDNFKTILEIYNNDDAESEYIKNIK